MRHLAILGPVPVLLQGAVTATFCTMWTLAWRRWTEGDPATSAPVAA